MKRFSVLRWAALLGLVSLAPLATMADEWDQKTVVTINVPTEVPGIVLQPGTYVFKLLNSQSNRHIAQIMNERMDHLYALTFTIPSQRAEPTDKALLTFYEETQGRPQALRKWFWPGNTLGHEFVYPKDQAARIAAATHEKVAEGNLPTVAESGQSLTPDNTKGLEVTERGAEAAAPLTASVETREPLPARVPEPVESAPPVSVVARNSPPPQVREEPAPAASALSEPAESLPETASHLPLMGAMGAASLALALAAAAFRRRRSV